MDGREVRARWEQAAAKAAVARRGDVRVAGTAEDSGQMTFLGAPLASRPFDLIGADVAVLGIPLTGSRSAAPPARAAGADLGASPAEDGPTHIRRHSLLSLEDASGLVMPQLADDVVILDDLRLVDYGDVVVGQAAIEATFVRAHERLADVFAAGAVPVILGGDPSISIPVLQVLAAKLSGKLGVVAIGARFDLGSEPRYATSSRWARAFELGVLEPDNFVQIGLRGFQPLGDRCVATELGHRWYEVSEVDEAGIATVAQEALESAASGTEAVYVSLDAGVIDPAHGGPPQAGPGGLTARELLRALGIFAAGPLAGFDISGVEPRDDPRAQLGTLAARAAVEVVAGLARQRP